MNHLCQDEGNSLACTLVDQLNKGHQALVRSNLHVTFLVSPEIRCGGGLEREPVEPKRPNASMRFVSGGYARLYGWTEPG